jgi:hypothetical protein
MINTDNILVIDDFLPPWLQQSLDNQMKNFNKWTICNVFSDHLINNQRCEEHYCTKVLYEDGITSWAEEDGITRILHDAATMDGILCAIPDADIKNLLRIRLNATFKSSPVYPHEDSPKILTDVWTVVYYINDSDGGTSFYHDKGHTLATTVDYKKGRAVIFPSSYYHNACTPVDHHVRITAGLMYKIDTKLNSNLYI